MKVEFENEELFKHLVKNHGLNLFLGAGFSVYARNAEDEPLPLSNEINNQLIKLFSLPLNREMDLSLTCQKIKRDNKDALNMILRDKYKVCSFDEAYLKINRFPIKNIFTTNIDDLIERIYANNESKMYISDVNLNGYVEKNNSVNLCKLHGSVNYSVENDLLFTKKELHDLFIRNNTLFDIVSFKLFSAPCIFWGTRLQDSNTLQLLCNTEKYSKGMPKWVVVYPRENYEIFIEDLKDLNFNIIKADTLDLINYISHMTFVDLSSDDRYIYKKYRDTFQNNYICKELIKKSVVRPVSDFFYGAEPQISDILSKSVIRTSYFNKIIEILLGNRITLITGLPGCGKSTLLLQLAFSHEIKGHKFWFNNMIESEAERIVKLTDGDITVVVFLDNLYSNVSAFQILKQCSRIKIVTAERDINYEYIKRYLHITPQSIVDVSDLNNTDIQNICRSMNRPSNDALTMIKQNNKVSLLEIVFFIYKSASVKERVSQYISTLKDYKEDCLLINLLELYIVINYTSYCGIAASMDMLYFYFSDAINSYDDILYALRKLNRIIVDAETTSFEISDDFQDYYAMRSKLFAQISLLIVPRKLLGKVLFNFLERINSRIIYRYDIFKKKSYDADITKRAFTKEEGINFYERILENNSNPYVRHQFALFLQRYGDLDNAWLQIDKAFTDSQKNIYSIANTHAIIMFEKNISVSPANEKQKLELQEILDRTFLTLEDCITKDIRVNYHVIIFSRHSIKYYEKFGSNINSIRYLERSYYLIDDILKSGEYISKRRYTELKSLYKDVNNIIRLNNTDGLLK